MPIIIIIIITVALMGGGSYILVYVTALKISSRHFVNPVPARSPSLRQNYVLLGSEQANQDTLFLSLHMGRVFEIPCIGSDTVFLITVR